MRILSIIMAVLIMAVLFLASGALVATPASAAEPLNWEMKIDAPSTIFSVLAPGTDILDYTSDNTGTTMYAATGKALMQTKIGGVLWANITNRLPAGVLASIDYVAMAPDDPNIVVVASSGNATVEAGAAITTNGGDIWTSMGVIQSGRR